MYILLYFSGFYLHFWCLNSQSVLMCIFNNTNWCKEEFIDASKHIEGCIKLVNGNIEYEQFLQKNK